MNEDCGGPQLRKYSGGSGKKAIVSKIFNQQSTEDRWWYETRYYLIRVERITSVPPNLVGAGYYVAFCRRYVVTFATEHRGVQACKVRTRVSAAPRT